MTYRYPGGLVRKTAANTSITGASGVWDLGSQAQAVKTNTWPISGLANPISGSLRFRSSVSAYLSRTPGVAGNAQKFTMSCWVKLGSTPQSSDQITFLNAGNGSQTNTTNDMIQLRTDGTALQVGVLGKGGQGGNYAQFSAYFRDYASWYHVVIAVDTTQATQANRCRAYVNGVEQTAFVVNGFTLNYSFTYLNSTSEHLIGKNNEGGGPIYTDAYFAEQNFIDGQALTPSSFGQTSPITGVWEPIKYTGTYGTNGFYLSLSDTSSIGKDFSGNGNNWTPNNISTASGSTFDLMRDVPTQYTPQGVTDVGGVVRGNYCTWNPLNRRTTTHIKTASDGNLNVSGDSNQTGIIFATIYPTTGKWYYEFSPANTYSYSYIGCGNTSENINQYPGYSTTSVGLEIGSGKVYKSSLQATYTGISAGEIGMIAWDCDTGKVWMGRQGTWFNSGDPAAGTGQVATLTAGENGAMVTPYSSSGVISTNFGQRPFTYAPPSGFKSLCTTNLPTPTIGATVATAANKYFDATLYTGTGATLAVTNSGSMQPDFVWIKTRNQAGYGHELFDSVRGATKYLISNSTNAEATQATSLTAFNSNGFSVGSWGFINDPGDSIVAWQWNAGGSTVTNTAGSISSQVRANPTAGFSIVTWTGSGSTATIGHGLGVAPKMFIWFHRTNAGAYSHITYHASLPSAAYVVYLNLSQAQSSDNNAFNSTAPTSSVFTVGGYNSSDTMVAYCFAEVAGYSAFGSYTGNGSADGTFVYTGFRPRYFMIKNTSVESWELFDTSRSTFNQAVALLEADSNGAENTSNTSAIDILSNGFKQRNTRAATNGSGATYIYMAFAEHPFKNSLAR